MWRAMSCHGYGLGELLIELKAERGRNNVMLPAVANLIRIRNALYQAGECSLTIKEFGAREILDFCNDHMDETLCPSMAD